MFLEDLRPDERRAGPLDRRARAGEGRVGANAEGQMARRPCKRWDVLTLLIILFANLSTAHCGPSASGASQQLLDQGWSDKQIDQWLHASQGSRLLPLRWFRALEQPTSSNSFLDPAFLGGFGYQLDERPGSSDPLPLGFVADRTLDDDLPKPALRWSSRQRSGEPWVGLTCSACHTSAITYKGSRLVVYGGPTLADYQSLIRSLDDSLANTAKDNDKFQRFARKVLNDRADSDRALLREALETVVEERVHLSTLNAVDIRYGFGRLDAIGQIYNRVALLSGAEVPTANPPNAPVSYPFLWNVPQQDHVQWDGLAMNQPLPAARGKELRRRSTRSKYRRGYWSLC